ncbi:MAG: serine hydrolase [Thermoanaerobaculia bacterium]
MTRRLTLAFLLAGVPVVMGARVPAGASVSAPKPDPLETISPRAAGFSAERLQLIDEMVHGAIQRHEVPGAVVLVGRHGRVVFRRAYGDRAIEPRRVPMSVDTVFDLASLTKPVATAPSVMLLVERGRVRLSDPVSRYLPGFAAGGVGRETITVEQLLLHSASLPPDDPLELYTGTPAEIFARKNALPLAHAPGREFVYSDVGYEYLGELVRTISGQPLDEFARRNIFVPLAMRDTTFHPLEKFAAARIAPTEKHDGAFTPGIVDDPRARALGGVAGHAGLFGTADDLARFCGAVLTGGGGVLSKASIAAMTRPRLIGRTDVRGLGWDIATGYSTVRGDLFPFGSFGHTGWTGTSMWLDPTTDTFVIILASRNHPDGKGDARTLRARVATLVAAAITDVPVETLRKASEPIERLLAAARSGEGGATGGPSAAVLAGIDVLERDGFVAIAGKRIALLTHAAGRTRDGRTSVEALRSEGARRAGVTLVRLFSPEHGLAGRADEKMEDGFDTASGLPIRSLYGDARRPGPDDFAGLDAVVVDLQDAGCRFYTYLTTMGYLLEEAAKAKVAVIVLDRPDPIGADRTEGPLADADALSFTAYHPIPIRTGLTIGEAAVLFQRERHLPVDLTVVPLHGYRRELWFDETGLPWSDPSPNLRSVTQAALYPGVALLETTNVSVGRGTDAPFELLGAPWMDGAALAARLSALGVPGARFVPVRFTPRSSTFAGEECGGIRITVLNRERLEPVRLGLEIAAALRILQPALWNSAGFGTLLASRATLDAWKRGESVESIVTSWAPGLRAYETRIAGLLLYPRLQP